MEHSICVLVLAAGKGTRMHSKTPKVLQQILEEPIISYLLTAIKDANFADVCVMVGYQGEITESYLLSAHPEVTVMWQREQLGTGHAAKLAQPWWKNYSHVMVLAGDTPLITAETLRNFADDCLSKDSKCAVLSFDMPNPTGYGRVIRDGSSIKIVEEKDATDAQRKCTEVNSGMYIFDTKALSEVIDLIGCENKQKEYYLPDAVALIQKHCGNVQAVKLGSNEDFLGINDPVQLAQAAKIMRQRIVRNWMLKGVRCEDPDTVWIGPKVTIAEDVAIAPCVEIYGNSSVGTGTTIGSQTVLRNTSVGENSHIIGSVRADNSKIGSNCKVGPFVFMREGAELADDALVGRYVEIKKSYVGKGSKVPHLSYIGDTTIGEDTNIGAGTITCNYDGKYKHKTNIGNNCFVGSDSILVAPVSLGDNSGTAAGSVITGDVPDGALGVGRARQRNISNWHGRLKPKQSESGGGNK